MLVNVVLLCEVINNLFDNVIKYVLVGGCVILCVGMEVDVVLWWWGVVSVEDNGFGILLEWCGEVF